MSSTETHIGQHLCRYEPPDTVVWKLSGDLSGIEMRRLYDETEALAVDSAYLLVLVDLSSAGVVSREARMASIEPRQQKGGGAAIVGASPHLRIIANFVIRAATLLHMPGAFPVQFFADEARARAWLLDLRGAIRAQEP